MAAVEQPAQHRVQVYLYDLSQGMAKALSAAILGKQIDGIWHTGLVVYGHEYYYGGGIQCAPPGHTLAGRPTQIIDMGTTAVPQAAFHDFLQSVSSQFTPETYSLLRHNCNNFTARACEFLTGRSIPDFITGLPEEALNTPMGQMLRPMIERMESNMRQNYSQFVPWQEEAARGELQLPSAPRGSSGAAPRAAAVSATPAAAASAAPPAGPSEAAGAVPAFSFERSHDEKHKSFEVLIKAASRPLDKAVQLSDAELGALAAVTAWLGAGSSAPAPAGAYALFERLVREWPAKSLFPVLGQLRLVALSADAGAHFGAQLQREWASGLPARLLALLTAADTPLPVRLMALCTLLNLLVHGSCGPAVASHANTLAMVRDVITGGEDARLRQTAASVMHNCCLALPRGDSDILLEYVSVLTQLLTEADDAVTELRLMRALVELVRGNDSAALVVSAMEFSADLHAVRLSGAADPAVASDLTRAAAAVAALCRAAAARAE